MIESIILKPPSKQSHQPNGLNTEDPFFLLDLNPKRPRETPCQTVRWI